jgi:hypothetical protein
MGWDDAVDDALERVYREFARVPCPERLQASPDRKGDELLKALTSSPLRDLPGEVIGPYAGWAMTSVGGPEDYRYFLPRILEISIQDNDWLGADPENIAQHLILAPWTAWPARQRAAVLGVFDAAFAWAIDTHPKIVRTAENWLCALAILGAPIELRLAAWRQAHSCEAALQLAWLIMNGLKNVGSAEADEGGYWKNVSAADREKIALWLCSDDAMSVLYNWLELAPEDDRWMIEHALLLLI